MKRAFTLIELILVLVILAGATAIAVPTYQGFVVTAQINDAAQRVELEFERTRLLAIRTGQIQVMRFMVNDRQASTQPWLSADDSANASGGATIMAQSGQILATDDAGGIASVGMTSNNWQVAESVIFSEAQVIGDMRSAVQIGTATLATASNGGWSNPILFYPDGSTSTARVVVQNRKGRRIGIELRGITGSTRVMDLVPGQAVPQ